MARTQQNAKQSGGKTLPGKDKDPSDSLPLDARQGMKTRKKRRLHPGTKALREIRRYQKATGLLAQKLPFQRMVRIIATGNFSPNSTPRDLRLKKATLPLLQESLEAHIVSMFEEALRMAIHRGRVTVKKVDMRLAIFTKYHEVKKSIYKV